MESIKTVRKDLKNYLKSNNEYRPYGGGYKNKNIGVQINSTMLEMQGEKIEVKEYKGSGYYNYKQIGDKEWAWIDEWLEPLAPELEGDEI